MRHALLAAAVAVLMTSTVSAQPIDPKVQARIDRILKATPLIDGHNDIVSSSRKITSAALLASRAAPMPGPTTR
jgi:membrane dipeptidase